MPTNTEPVPALLRFRLALMEEDTCPDCLGELDTGWECDDCGFDGASEIEASVHRCRLCKASLAVCDLCGVAWCLDHTPNPLSCPQCGARP